jgi:Zn-dependent protease
MDTTEVLHITVSVITISIAFSVMGLYAGGLLAFATSFPVILLTLGLGFVLHEMGHKYVAQRYGCWAVYRAWLPGLALAVGLALMSGGRFVFAAPGAVYIGGKRISTKENGVISIAGPLVNLALGIIFLFIANSSDVIISTIGGIGASINFFLAFFNMIPFPPLDGSKVIQWSLPVWLLGIATAGAFMFLF